MISVIPHMPRGWKKHTCLFLLGSLASLAMPPLGAFWVLFLCVPAFLAFSQQSMTKRESYACGFFFGAGYFIAGLYWISIALFVDIHSFWWVLPLSAIIGPGVLGLFYGFIPLAAWPWRTSSGRYTLMFCAIWAAIEWLRGHLFTGFPWNLAGYSWVKILPMMQSVALFGIYGLTLATLLWAAAPFVWQEKRLRNALIFSFVLAFAFGAMRLHAHPSENTPFWLRIVQPNIPQTLKWDETAEQENFIKHLRLTSPPPESGDKTPDIIIWPETALKADPISVPELAQVIARRMPSQSILLTGALRGEENENGMRFYNSIVAIDAAGGRVAPYDKHHLVPFGEYIPFRRYLNLTPIAADIAQIGDFTAGSGPATLSLPRHLPRPSPLICYEAIFPGAVAQKKDRPNWLLNVTNDAWYGRSAGPYQHFEISRTRAIEEGLPLARAANTGISGMIDPLGRVVRKSHLNESGFYDTALPAALPPTLYARFGDAIFFAMLIALSLAAGTGRKFT